MRRTGGALLVAVGLLAGGCAQSIKDLDVPADFQQVVKDISAGAQPSFSGSTCFSKHLDRQDSWRYQASYTASGSVDAVTKQLRKDGLAHGFQPFRTNDGKFLMVRKYKREQVIVGAVAEGQNTKVSAVSQSNCVGDKVARDPLTSEVLSANPDLEPRQKRLLDGAYKATREAGFAIYPLLDRDNRITVEQMMPATPPNPDNPSLDLKGCDVDDAGAYGAQWSTLSDGVMSGFIGSTEDVKVGEQRVVAALGRQWQVVDRKQDERTSVGIALSLEQKVENVTARLGVQIQRKEDNKKRWALDISASMQTGCVPPTAR